MEDTYKGQVDNPLSLNRYTYVHNNPIRFVDPTGHYIDQTSGGYLGGNHVDLLMSWGERAVTYADAHKIDYDEAVEAIVPAHLKKEVHEIVFQIGATRTQRIAGDVPDLGLAASATGALAAGTLKNTSKGTGKNLSHPVLDNTRSGSGLKQPDGQHGFNDIIDNYTPYAKEFDIVGGDGVKRKLYQIEGGMKYYDYKDVYNKELRIKERVTTIKDQNGIFEWIVDPTKGVTHRRFIPNGEITGVPNQRP
ncbi:hypothetical protein [Brevibacillus sp. MER 51]|uniref:hypothetical protein n=1 Tax=Brevibacillus sp. MER 51 TaxID=2939560 RepID=UPI00203EC74C|nr:hypothetical protein [Brevibacillus sp. MER 51]MCM3141851.1 hypothetical protein [Brevibacillus sp. MER 51]